MNEFDTIEERLTEAIDKISGFDCLPDEDRNLVRRLISGALALVKRHRKDNDELALQIRTHEKAIANLDKLIANFGFKRVWTGVSGMYTSRFLRGCKCGHEPYVQEVCDTKNWIVLCNKCYLRTEEHQKIKDAIKAWNDGCYTETSLMLQTKLTKDTVDEQGLTELAIKVCEMAADDYVGGTVQSRESLKKFFRASPIMMGADGDAMIENLDAKIAKKKEKTA